MLVPGYLGKWRSPGRKISPEDDEDDEDDKDDKEGDEDDENDDTRGRTSR